MGNVEVTRKLGIVLNGGCSGETALTLRVQDITANNRLRATISYVQQVVIFLSLYLSVTNQTNIYYKYLFHIFY